MSSVNKSYSNTFLEKPALEYRYIRKNKVDVSLSSGTHNLEEV